MADESSKQNGPVQAQVADTHEVAEVRELWETYGRSIITGVLIAVVLVLGLSAFRNYKTGKREQAAFALAGARNVEEFQEVISRYAKTPSAPVASLGMARTQFANGDYNGALASYDAFLAANPEHPMADAVKICRAQTLEASGQLTEAISAFQAFQESKAEDHYLQPQAALGVGRSLEQLERWDEARSVYEEIIAAHPESDWATQAEVALRYVRKVLSSTAP